MKIYEKPEMQVDIFDVEDIITTSNPEPDMGDGNWMGGLPLN